MMKVLICGGRNLNQHDVWNVLERDLKDNLYEIFSSEKIDVIIQGGASGADNGAKNWAKSEDIKCIEFKADWKKHGKAAGPIRNRRMLEVGKPDVVCAFEGCRGTANMMKQAYEYGVPVITMRTPVNN
jgi:hypothetical protein